MKLERETVMGKLDQDKIKENLSDAKRFARNHRREVLTGVAILVATFSSWGHFFVGTMGWSLLFVAIGALAALFCPRELEQGIEKMERFSIGEKRLSRIALHGVKIAVALFLPFLYFGLIGIHAGLGFSNDVSE